jgi:hypothetical protein
MPTKCEYAEYSAFAEYAEYRPLTHGASERLCTHFSKLKLCFSAPMHSGLHEPYEFYRRCKLRERNKGAATLRFHSVAESARPLRDGVQGVAVGTVYYRVQWARVCVCIDRRRQDSSLLTKPFALTWAPPPRGRCSLTRVLQHSLAPPSRGRNAPAAFDALFPSCPAAVVALPLTAIVPNVQ